MSWRFAPPLTLQYLAGLEGPQLSDHTSAVLPTVTRHNGKASSCYQECVITHSDLESLGQAGVEHITLAPHGSRLGSKGDVGSWQFQPGQLHGGTESLELPGECLAVSHLISSITLSIDIGAHVRYML